MEPDYSDAVQDERTEEQAEILQSTFHPEEDGPDPCAQEFSEKPQDSTEGTASCPALPEQAALLSPWEPFPRIVSFWGSG